MTQTHAPYRSTPAGRWVFWIFMAIAAFYLLTEHRAHLALGIPYLPFLFLAACPLMHLFGHGHHMGHDRHRDPQRGPAAPTPERSEEPAGVSHQHHGGMP